MARSLGELVPTAIRLHLRKFLNVRRRRAIAMSYYAPQLARIDRWVWRDTETSNFYYGLTPLNRDHLAQLISAVTGERHDRIVHYFEELETDGDLRRHLESALRGTDYGSEIRIDYGRRLGWYAFVRVLRPKVVVETGVDHGVGSCVLASALLRNAAEGLPGRYFGTDIRPEAGQLFRGKYAETGTILYGDSIASLAQLAVSVDLFVNDSDHSADYEYREYQTIVGKLSERAVLLGDNAHATESLSRFSRETGRKFVFFGEKPEDHWYPGAGIGISYR